MSAPSPIGRLLERFQDHVQDDRSEEDPVGYDDQAEAATKGSHLPGNVLHRALSGIRLDGLVDQQPGEASIAALHALARELLPLRGSASG